MQSCSLKQNILANATYLPSTLVMLKFSFISCTTTIIPAIPMLLPATHTSFLKRFHDINSTS